MRRLFCKFHFLSQPPPSMQQLLDVAVLNLFLDLCSFLLFGVKLGTSAWCFKVFSPRFRCSSAATIMSFLHGSDFTLLGHLSVQRQDALLDVFCSTLHGPISFLPVTGFGFSWKATPSTGTPQSSGRCCGARQSPSRASPKMTL